MARLTFPDEGSRLVFRMTGSGKPLLSAAAGTATIYADAGATALADIQTLGGVTVLSSTLTVTDASQLPLFLGPDGVDTVWCSVDGGPLAPVYARNDDRLDALESAVGTDTIGVVVRSVNGQAPNAEGAVFIAQGAVADAAAGTKGVVQLAGDLGGTAAAPTTPTALHKTGAETAAGLKTFNDGVLVPDASITQAKVSGLTAALDAKAAYASSMVVVNHGAVASTARPVGAAAVYWIGTVTPTNMSTTDLYNGPA